MEDPADPSALMRPDADRLRTFAADLDADGEHVLSQAVRRVADEVPSAPEPDEAEG